MIQSLWNEAVNKSNTNLDTNLPSKLNDFVVHFSKLGKSYSRRVWYKSLSLLWREKKKKGKKRRKTFKQLLKQKMSCFLSNY